ncbi:MAG: hypothetical protein ACI83B_002462 [Sediminicola sp.]|jgi:hypothetical protein
MKSPILLLYLSLCTFTLSAQYIRSGAVEYAEDYYSSFTTGYDVDGKYITISDNYKATFSDSIFTLSFDTFDENRGVQKQIITINLKEVISIAPNGTAVAEILDNDPSIVPIYGKLAFTTTNESYDINIYFEVDEDVTTSQIYKAFEELTKN